MPDPKPGSGQVLVKVLVIAPSYYFRGFPLPGSYAQFVVVPQEFVLSDTTELPVEQIATLPVPLLTAISAVQLVGEVKAGDFVLVHAGGSATGLMSIQVARVLGAKVYVRPGS